MKWEQFKKLCNGKVLQNRKDKLIWTLTKNGVFTVKSFYYAMKLQDSGYPFKQGRIHNGGGGLETPLPPLGQWRPL